MDIWKGTFLPLRKHVVDAGFIDDIPELDADYNTDEYWEQYADEGYGTWRRAHERAAELKNEDIDPEETTGVMFVALDDTTVFYMTNFAVYLAFEASGFSTDYYNEKVRILPFPAPIA